MSTPNQFQQNVLSHSALGNYSHGVELKIETATNIDTKQTFYLWTRNCCRMAAALASFGTFMYFSYGSNLLQERIHIKNPSSKFHSLGKLEGYKFTYDAPVDVVDYLTDYWMGATATIRQSTSEDHVWGVIWEIDVHDLEALDKQEEYYHPIEVNIVHECGHIVKCRTYEMVRNTINDRKPNPYYKKVVLAGAKQNKLPEEYVQFLEAFPDNGLQEIPPLYLGVLEAVKSLKQGNLGTANLLDSV